MTRIAPISRATLDAVVLNDNMESVLTLGAGPQTLALELTNLTQKDITLGDAHGTSLALTFRPGGLAGSRRCVDRAGRGMEHRCQRRAYPDNRTDARRRGDDQTGQKTCGYVAEFDAIGQWRLAQYAH